MNIKPTHGFHTCLYKINKSKIKNGDNYTRLHALTRKFIDICILAPLREPCKLRVSACKRVSYLLIFSFIDNYIQ